MMLVVGVGNRFMGDDGCGSYAAETLQRILGGARGLEIRDLGSGPMNLIYEASTLSSYSGLIIIDASLGTRAGDSEVISLGLDEARVERIVSGHTLDVYTTLSLIRKMGHQVPPTLLITCGVEEEELSPRLGLSEKALRSTVAAVKRVLEILMRMGISQLDLDEEDILQVLRSVVNPGGT
jgi:hydrogenase maturation protease